MLIYTNLLTYIPNEIKKNKPKQFLHLLIIQPFPIIFVLKYD